MLIISRTAFYNPTEIYSWETYLFSIYSNRIPTRIYIKIATVIEKVNIYYTIDRKKYYLIWINENAYQIIKYILKKLKVTYSSSPQLLLEGKLISLSPCIIYENRNVVLAHLAMFTFNLSFFIYCLWINRFRFYSNANTHVVYWLFFPCFLVPNVSFLNCCHLYMYTWSHVGFFLIANDRSGTDSFKLVQQKDRFAICWMYNDLYKCAIIASF